MIVPEHVAGVPCAMDEISALARDISTAVPPDAYDYTLTKTSGDIATERETDPSAHMPVERAGFTISGGHLS